MRKFIFIVFLISLSVLNAAQKPNILWLTCEDNNVTWLGCYGNKEANTPNIDGLAKEGFQYMNCYANAPVCAPSRSTWITGIHATSMGTQPMRSRYPIPHKKISYYPDLLKKAGYYVVNAGKTDYNIGDRKDKEAWDTSKLNWKAIKKKQPFFVVINTTKSHESKAFGDVNNSKNDPAKMKLAKYHPDIPDVRKNYAHYLDQVEKMDQDIGKSLAQLKKMGLDKNTIVVHNSDHGGVLPRSKRYLYNSGTHCPLIVRIPKKYKELWPAEPGSKVYDMVSFIDMPKTWLNLCGAEQPEYLQGKVFLGKNKEKRDYHVSFRGRMDERHDHVRAIRHKQYLYIRNYMPYVPNGQRLEYLWRMKATQAWVQHHKNGNTNEVTGRYFKPKVAEEFYDTSKDPDNVNNLMNNPEYKQVIINMKEKLAEWKLKTYDSGFLPESERVRRAEANHTTIYEMVRQPKLYDVALYQKVADLALAKDSSQLGQIYEYLNHKDLAVRYWAMTACVSMLDKVDLKVIETKLKDESHEVRALAASIFNKRGEKEKAKACLNDMLKNQSYATLKILNLIDWLGEGIEPYAEAIEQANKKKESYSARIKKYLSSTNQ